MFSFKLFFERVTGNAPYDCPCRLACGERAPELDSLRLARIKAVLPAADMRASALAAPPCPPQLSAHELAGDHRSVAQPSRAGETAPPLGQHPGAGGAEHGLRERAGGRESASRETRPEHATRFIETSQGLLSYTARAPLLAERVQALDADLSGGACAALPLEDELMRELHRRIVGDLVSRFARDPMPQNANRG